jgi:effector-binding domain-containing protein
MQFDTVTTTAQPMLHVSRSSTMADMAKTMGGAFGEVGAFLGQHGIVPLGPPVCVYRKWENDSVSYDIGFPVARADLAKATGNVKAGETPSARALKGVHKGPYDALRQTYAAMEGYMRDKNIPMPSFSWEVYLSDPDRTPATDLLTEIYMPLP